MNTKRTWRYSIKIKLIIAFMMISLIPVITISIITQNITKNNTENIELENMSNITKITAQNVDDWFQKRISLVEETIKKHPE
ncbi:methyl-accepting chemotaxis protein, partial [Paenibacillus larvae]|nr:methyl-accepting chemotaxis protein [Paenibacillus larvae]MDT2182112.1 methyl-accepting chemotaxis protein [Paenibacillus larvae]MDT2197973.1 methyl-accepting chemotaxis protein [Paenibacillus larvae]MDT2207479.1 methyl-accepting chemotaxis protein [Paenibacillus larvae]